MSRRSVRNAGALGVGAVAAMAACADGRGSGAPGPSLPIDPDGEPSVVRYGADRAQFAERAAWNVEYRRVGGEGGRPAADRLGNDADHMTMIDPAGPAGPPVLAFLDEVACR